MRSCLLLLLLSVSTFSLSASTTNTSGLIFSKEQKAMLTTQLSDIHGNDIVLKHKPGHVSIIHFWATWCVPCRQELPLLTSLANKLKPHGLRVVMVAADSHQSVREYTATHTLPRPVLIDQYGAAIRDYDVRGLPSSYVINRSGIISYIAEGQIDWNNKHVTELLEKMLSQE